MDVEQILSLIASTDDPDGRLIPELREVAAWTAMLDGDVLAEVLAREPDVLLRADALGLSDERRAQLVAGLLTEEISTRIARYDRRVQYALSHLVHPGLAEQIRGTLQSGQALLVRQMAFALAHAAALPELQGDLVEFAFNLEEPAFLRHDAVWALTDYADEPTRAALVPLATQPIEDDEGDEIKGQALEATFPSILGVADVLAALTPPRNERLLGIYKMFVRQTLPNALRPTDLPVALEWAANLPWHPEQQTYSPPSQTTSSPPPGLT